MEDARHNEVLVVMRPRHVQPGVHYGLGHKAETKDKESAWLFFMYRPRVYLQVQGV